MQLLIDTNILAYAANHAVPQHAKALAFLDRHLQSGTPWCLTWQILYEFSRIATHAQVFAQPLTASQAMRFLEPLVENPAITMLTPGIRHFDVLRQTLKELGRPAGNIFHDIAIAVTLREHGVSQIVTADAHFHQFKFLKVINPLVSSA